MSRRREAPYVDQVLLDGTIIYEGHNRVKGIDNPNPKLVDQPRASRSGTLTQNGLVERPARSWTGLVEL